MTTNQKPDLLPQGSIPQVLADTESTPEYRKGQPELTREGWRVGCAI
jgi:hypothetical protein